MSVSHPLLKELKGHVFDLRKCSQVTEICDYHPMLFPLCCTLESIFREGLKASCATAFGVTKKDYWFWICLIYEQRGKNNIPFSLCDAIERSKDCEKVYSCTGKGRLFIRTSLAKKLFQPLLTCFVEDKLLVCSAYDPVSSILGNEILAEIFSSLLYELSKIDFKLELKNASFLDETWNLGVYRKYEFVPCKEMGITFGCIKGRVIVVKVEDGSVAAEENQVEVGDVLDELFGHSLYKCKKGLIQSLAHQFQGLPVYLSVVKCCINGRIYTPLLPILDKLHLQEIVERKISHSLLNESTENKLNTRQHGSPSDDGSSGLSCSSPQQFELILLGKIFMGKEGNVTQVEKAIAKAIEQSKDAKNIIMEICETKLKVYEKSAGEAMVVKHFTEISACGRKANCPEKFAVMCGDTTCTFAEEFHCYVFQARCDEEAKAVLSSIAQGFGRTHWAV